MTADRSYLARVFLKGILLFTLLNLIFAAINGTSWLSVTTVYNRLVPGRERLPFAASASDVNITSNNISLLFAAHVVSMPASSHEKRVFIAGDSSVWGYLLDHNKTIAAQVGSILPDDIRVFNLGFPTLSALKDLLLLDYSLQFQPDLIIWFTTLDALYRPRQFDSALVQNNTQQVNDLSGRYMLDISQNSNAQAHKSWSDNTMWGQRRFLSDWWRLQVLGFLWMNTRMDSSSVEYIPVSRDLDSDLNWQGHSTETDLPADWLMVDVFEKAQHAWPETRLLVVNEPILISRGINSESRYNAWYPHWVYQRYQRELRIAHLNSTWHYLDLFNLVPEVEFTDSPVHVSEKGTALISERLAPIIISSLGDTP